LVPFTAGQELSLDPGGKEKFTGKSRGELLYMKATSAKDLEN
jgi:hypothetical protein